jgi:tetratricopeptide (TPR) repeat protein
MHFYKKWAKKVKKLKNQGSTQSPEKKKRTNSENESPLVQTSQTNSATELNDVTSTKPVSKGTASKYSTEQLLSKTEDCIDSFDYELAEKFCQRAFDLDPQNLRTLEMLGFLRLQSGDLDESRKHFSKAIALDPETGHSKYMYIGQLSTGLEAIEFYHKGISIMKNALSVKDQESATAAKGTAVAEVKTKSEVSCRDISSAYCAIAELYLTDACFEDDAEVRCRENIDLAIEADTSNAEAYQTLASFCLCKEDTQRASEAIEKGLSLWLPQLREVHKTDNSDLVDPVQACPISYSVRISFTKTLIELKNYEVAEEILGLLILEDSEVVEVWYLLGWMNYLRGDEFYANAKYHLTKGHELAVKLHCDDEQMVEHMTELLQELGGPATESDLEGEDGEEELLSDSGEENGIEDDEEIMDQ